MILKSLVRIQDTQHVEVKKHCTSSFVLGGQNSNLVSLSCDGDTMNSLSFGGAEVLHITNFIAVFWIKLVSEMAHFYVFKVGCKTG